MSKKTAGIIWAQRMDRVFMTITVPEAKDITYDIKDGKFFEIAFKNRAGDIYEQKLEFFGKVKAKESQWKNNRFIEFNLVKEEEKNWTKLNISKVKMRNIGIDWNKWIDEEDEEDTFDWGKGDKLKTQEEGEKKNIDSQKVIQDMMKKMQNMKKDKVESNEKEDDIEDLDDLDDVDDDDDIPNLETVE